MSDRYRCRNCGTYCNHAFRVAYHVAPLCEECADRMTDCEHESGRTERRYDEDGCGFTRWTCDDCGYWNDE